MIRPLWIGASLALTGTLAVAAIPPLKVTLLGKPDAPVTGTFQRNLHSEPDDFSPMSGSSYVSRLAYENCVEGLLWQNPETFKFEPQLAENYEISKDFLTYTFYLNKKATWSDGKPVTSEDVKFSIEAVRDPKYKAAHRMPYYDDVESIETPDAHTVKIKMKAKYYANLETLGTQGTTPILPKHIYGDPKYKFAQAPIVGSGPYMVEAYNRGKNLMLVRNKSWWANDISHLKALGKFERVNFRFIKDESMQVEMVKKGQIDYMWPMMTDTWVQKATGEPFGTTVKKMEVENEIPKRYGFVAWNQKNPLFQDREVRVALAQLLNRKLLIEKFQFGKAVEGMGPFYYKSEFMPPGLKPWSFDPEKAKAALKKAGWEDRDKNGILEKTVAGKPLEFRFALLLPSRDTEKYFTIYKEDLKKAGIDMEIKLVEWSTFTTLLDEQKFDAVTLAWAGGSVEPDLKQIWHSDSARLKGSNFINYKNLEVDKAIEMGRQEMNKEKRKVYWRKVAKLIHEDAPYAFLFNLKSDLFLVNSRIGFDKPTYRYDFSHRYWYSSL